MRREMVIIVESYHVEVDDSCDVEFERLVNHIECDTALNLTRVFQESLFVNIGSKEVVFK